MPASPANRGIARVSGRASSESLGVTLALWISLPLFVLPLPACVATDVPVLPEDWMTSFQSTAPAARNRTSAATAGEADADPAGGKEEKKDEEEPPPPQEEESEVIEERRRGFQDDAPPEQEEKPGVRISWDAGTSPRLDASDGGVLHDWTFGLNWYPIR